MPPPPPPTRHPPGSAPLCAPTPCLHRPLCSYVGGTWRCTVGRGRRGRRRKWGTRGAWHSGRTCHTSWRCSATRSLPLTFHRILHLPQIFVSSFTGNAVYLLYNNDDTSSGLASSFSAAEAVTTTPFGPKGVLALDLNPADGMQTIELLTMGCVAAGATHCNGPVWSGVGWRKVGGGSLG